MTITAEQFEAVTQRFGSPPTAVPCPDWCTSQPGHPYELEDENFHEGRHHAAKFAADETGSTSAEVVTESYWIDGAEQHSTPVIKVWIDGNDYSAPIETPEVAHRLGLALIEAASKLEEIL